MKKLILILGVILLTVGCTSNTVNNGEAVVEGKVISKGETAIPTEEQALAEAQIGVATQKQILSTTYFTAVSECLKDKDFIFIFANISCPLEGCSMALNGAEKRCDTSESRQALQVALNSIKQPKSKAGFYEFAMNLADTTKELTLGVLGLGVEVATSQNAGLLGVGLLMNKMGDKIGDRDSGNVTTTITQNAQGDFLDNGSSKDLSNNSVVTNTESVGNDKIIGNSDRIDNSINDSQNPVTTDSNDNNSTVTEVVPATAEPEEGSN